MVALRNAQVFELAILSETQRHLDALSFNPAYANTLLVPDGSRAIFDTDEKWQGLLRLSKEMDDLLSNVFAENAPGVLSYSSSMSQKRGAVAVATVSA